MWKKESIFSMVQRGTEQKNENPSGILHLRSKYTNTDY